MPQEFQNELDYKSILLKAISMIEGEDGLNGTDGLDEMDGLNGSRPIHRRNFALHCYYDFVFAYSY